MAAPSLTNNFLIAMPALSDPFFHHSVVYICDHSDQGTMGLIINRRTQIMLGELLEHVHMNSTIPQADTIPVLFGGPVQKNQGMVLHNTTPTLWAESTVIADNIVLTSSTDILKAISHNEGPENILVALGYASWQAGQLEQEIADNSWLTAPADYDILFNTPSEDRWHKAASLLGVDITLISDSTGHA